MTRFAGSAVDFTPQSLASAGGGTNYSSAAGAVDVNSTYAAQREKAPRYDQLSATAMQAKSAEKQAAMSAEGDVMAAGIASLGQAKSGQMAAQASIKAAEAQAEATKSSGMMSAIGGIAGAGLKLLTGGIG